MTLLLAFALASLGAQADPPGHDSDGDGLSNFHEIHKHRTDPQSADSDGDGLPDGDWNERREFTYTVRSIVEVTRPVTPEYLTDDFQDARVLMEAEDRVQLEVLHYPYSTAPDALAEIAASDATVSPEERARWLAPGPTSDWDEELRTKILEGLGEAEIDATKLDDPRTIEAVAKWLLGQAVYRDGDVAFASAYDEDGRPYIPEEISDHVAGGRPISAEDFAREVSAKGMFLARTRGSCTPSAIYMSGCLRAIGIPTRTVLCIPLIDAGDERELQMVQDRIDAPAVRRAILGGVRGLENSWASHTFNEVLLGGRWWRLDYDELGVGILRRNRFGIMTHVATLHDWADARTAETIGRRQALRLRDSVLDGANPYSTLVVDDHVGEHNTLVLPEPKPLVATIQTLEWTDEPELPAHVKANATDKGRFGLIAHMTGLDSMAELQDILLSTNPRIWLHADDVPRLSVGLEKGCCWFWTEGNQAHVYVPFGPADRRDLATDVAYTPRRPEPVGSARIELAEGIVVIRRESVPNRPESKEPRRLRGVVVDVNGDPVRARVAAIGDSGSKSMSNDPSDGRFEIHLDGDDSVLLASTEDGRVAVETIPEPGEDARLVVEPGARLKIDMIGRDENCRCAVFQGELRIEDFTLRPGKTSSLVVPGGSVRVLLYARGEDLAEHSVELAVGESHAHTFDLSTNRR